eukprot:6194186-Pleurochrysis_carterae.AAC.3
MRSGTNAMHASRGCPSAAAGLFRRCRRRSRACEYGPTRILCLRSLASRTESGDIEPIVVS